MYAIRPFRRIAPVLTVVAVAGLLAGCSSSTPTGSGSASAATPSASASVAPLTCATSGSGSKSVKVTGATTKQATVKFPTPLSVTDTQQTVVKAGSGKKVAEGSSVTIAYSLYSGKTGKLLDTAGYDSAHPAAVISIDTTQYLYGLVQALDCSQAGARIASVIPASKAFGDTGSETLGVAAGESLVFVVDVRALTATKANGTAKTLPSGFPKVTLASSGQPTVTIPKATAPTTLKIADSKTGTGETVKSGDSVTVQYQGVLWRTGKVFDQSWGKTGPTALTTTGVVSGFGKALVGQKVGSQVVAIIPPAEGYKSAGQASVGIKGTDTMVFVIDILATQHVATK